MLSLSSIGGLSRLVAVLRCVLASLSFELKLWSVELAIVYCAVVRRYLLSCEVQTRHPGRGRGPGGALEFLSDKSS